MCARAAACVGAEHRLHSRERRGSEASAASPPPRDASSPPLTSRSGGAVAQQQAALARALSALAMRSTMPLYVRDVAEFHSQQTKKFNTIREEQHLAHVTLASFSSRDVQRVPRSQTRFRVAIQCSRFSQIGASQLMGFSQPLVPTFTVVH